MSKPVILLDAGQLVSLVGSADGDVLTWDANSSAWVSEAGGGGGGGSGTVTSVTLDAGSTGLTISAGYSQTITTSGTFLLGGTLGAGYGGTGVSSTSQSFVFCGPASGLGTPSFRQLSAADITGISGTYAPLASPTFTGTVTLPLATAGYVKTTSGGVISSSATVAVADLSGAVSVASGGTNNASLSVVQGTVYYGNGSQLVGLAPGTNGQFLQTQGAGADPQWAAAGGGGGSGAYDLRGMFVGNPASSAVIDRFVADRAVTVSTTTTDHRFYCATLPASGTVVLTACKTPLAGTGKVAMFTATYTAGGTAAGNGLYAATIGAVSNNTLVAGDLVTVEVGTTQAAFATPVWTISGTA